MSLRSPSAALIILALSAPAAPQPAPRLCASNGNTIFLINSETGAQEAAIPTPYPYEVRSAKLTPDGQRIIYIQKAGPTGKRQVFSIPVAGGEPTELATMPQNCDALDISADGQTVVFSHATAKPRLWEVSPGGEPVQLTGDRDRAPDGTESWGDFWPALGPQDLIAYYRVGKAGGRIVCDIYCVDTAGSFIANLTDRIALEDLAGLEMLTGVTNLDWSADGRCLIFSVLYDDGGPKRDLFRIDLQNDHAGTNLTVNRPELREESGPQSIHMLTLSPTSRIIYSPHIPSPGLLSIGFLGDHLGAPRPLTSTGAYRWPSCAP